MFTVPCTDERGFRLLQFVDKYLETEHSKGFLGFGKRVETHAYFATFTINSATINKVTMGFT